MVSPDPESDRTSVTGPGRAPQPAYSERLWPSPAMWLVVGALALCTAAILLPIRPAAAAAGAALIAVCAATALLRASARVAVEGDVVIAGHACVAARFVHRAEPLDRAGTREAVGPGLDARSMLRVRPWVHTAVLIVLDDPDDPVPAWIVSSRRPAAFAAAITAAKAAERP
jgi:hypothetical protein